MTIKPRGIAAHAEQLRPAIVRGKGLTASERYLATLGEQSFLNLWSYPNPYRKQMDNPGARQGKELCDLLIVCGPHVIIFSEKTIVWQANKPLSLAWTRWFRGAVRDAVKQIRGAERWIIAHPSQIFLDPECKIPLPIALPSPCDMIIHRVVVARGAAEACRRSFGRGSGSLHIRPDIVGRAHDEMADARAPEPFCIGDLDPEEPFVHVLDEASLEVVLGELDTVTDLTAYLRKREAFIRSGHLARAEGEENLVAYYATNINDRGDHDFTSPNGGMWQSGETITIESTVYASLQSNPQYIAKQRADRISYLWDRLIEMFTGPLLDGTSLVLDGREFDLRKSELGVRAMALVSRLERRVHGQAIADAFEKGRRAPRFFRLILEQKKVPQNEVAFFILIMNFRPEDGIGYEEFRLLRSYFSGVYARAILQSRPVLRRVVGISMEAPGRGMGGSEEMVYAEQQTWTDDDRQEVVLDCAKLGIFQDVKEKPISVQEYPEVEIRFDIFPRGPGPLEPVPNRAERRRAAANARKMRKRSD